MRITWKFLVTLSALGITLIVLFCWIWTLRAPPCQTLWTPDVTGVQRYDGNTIQCFHGQVMRVNHHG